MSDEDHDQKPASEERSLAVALHRYCPGLTPEDLRLALRGQLAQKRWGPWVAAIDQIAFNAVLGNAAELFSRCEVSSDLPPRYGRPAFGSEQEQSLAGLVRGWNAADRDVRYALIQGLTTKAIDDDYESRAKRRRQRSNNR